MEKTYVQVAKTGINIKHTIKEVTPDQQQSVYTHPSKIVSIETRGDTDEREEFMFVCGCVFNDYCDCRQEKEWFMCIYHKHMYTYALRSERDSIIREIWGDFDKWNDPDTKTCDYYIN